MFEISDDVVTCQLRRANSLVTCLSTSLPPTHKKYDFILLECQNLSERGLSLGDCTYKSACVVT